MKRTLLLTAAVLAACSQQDSGRDARSPKTYDVQEEPQGVVPRAPPQEVAMRAADSSELAAGPNVGVTAAPGVAFNYRYAFRLPNGKIAAAQETHASMCEKLGVTRCRITGMRYSLVNERDVSASLELKLDPAIARQFGKDATKIVTDAKGMLVDQEITGVDAGSSIERANRGRAELQDELDRVTKELARPGLSSAVRDRLLSEAASLRSQIRSLGEQKAADEDSLAKTPMVFNYGSGKVIPGFDEPAPLSQAFDRAGHNLLSAIGFLIIAIATLLPWVLLISLAVWAYRRLPARLRIFSSRPGETAAERPPAQVLDSRPEA